MIVAVVPAAGRSSRMGQPKLLMDFGDGTLIRRVVAALRGGGAERVVVVAPPGDEPEGPPIADEARSAGALVLVPEIRPVDMRSSVELGLATLDTNPPPLSVLLTPADVPGITPKVVDRLRVASLDRPGFIMVPEYQGRRGHPIVLPWDIALKIRSLPCGVGVNQLLARHADRLIELPVPTHDVLVDIDTPEDLRGWKADPAESIPQPVKTLVMKVRLFAMARDRVGQPELRLELSASATVADLRQALRAHSPELAPLWSSALIAVDEEYASDDMPIRPSPQLAVIPPVSGGITTSSSTRRGRTDSRYHR